MCPACRQPLAACECGSTPAEPKGDGIVRVSRDTRGRGGKTVTVIRGVPLEGDALAALGKQLRAACGTGGTLKDGVLELQGDHRDRALAWLQSRGWTVKLAGG